MTFYRPYARARKRDRVSLAAFNLELSFQIGSEPEVTQRRRLLLVTEAFKSIADQDDRLASWHVHPLNPEGWVTVRAVICAARPDEAALLGEKWMSIAISAANLADDPAAARLPQQRSLTELLMQPSPMANLTSRVGNHAAP